jgi:hypothetical protein
MYNHNSLKVAYYFVFMKKGIFAVIISFLIVSLIMMSVLALNPASVSGCKRDCRMDKSGANSLCINNFNECKKNCINISESCLIVHKEEYNSCKNECSILSNRQEKSKCSSACLRNFTINKKVCNSKLCLSSCNSNKKSCSSETTFRFSDCSNNCKYAVLNNNVTCENGKYNAGETFLLGCDICKCKYDSTVDCKKTLFCNFNDLTIEESKCVSSGGFYQQLCNGPYFDIVCSQNDFCQCDGNSNYSCPEGYACIHNFTSSLTRKSQTIAGFKTLLGFELGDIGLCAKKPILESCGNGICENQFLKNGNNPETSYNCPEDCK